MRDRLRGFQNTLWAVGIFAAGLALLIGLVLSMSARYAGERQSGTMTLGQGSSRPGPVAAPVAESGGAAPALMELPSTQKTGLETVFGMTFLCDKTVLGLRNYVQNYGDAAAASIWTDSGGGFPAATAAETEIVFVDGSLITPASAAMILKPRQLVIYLGGDGLAETDEQGFIDGYTALIDSIREVSPNTQIICCSIASVSSNYQGSDGLTPELIAKANQWIRQVCINTGCWFADLAPLVNDEYGYLSDAYLMPDGRSIASAGIALIVDYFRFHGIA